MTLWKDCFIKGPQFIRIKKICDAYINIETKEINVF